MGLLRCNSSWAIRKVELMNTPIARIPKIWWKRGMQINLSRKTMVISQSTTMPRYRGMLNLTESCNSLVSVRLGLSQSTLTTSSRMGKIPKKFKSTSTGNPNPKWMIVWPRVTTTNMQQGSEDLRRNLSIDYLLKAPISLYLLYRLNSSFDQKTLLGVSFRWKRGRKNNAILLVFFGCGGRAEQLGKMRGEGGETEVRGRWEDKRREEEEEGGGKDTQETIDGIQASIAPRGVPQGERHRSKRHTIYPTINQGKYN